MRAVIWGLRTRLKYDSNTGQLDFRDVLKQKNQAQSNQPQPIERMADENVTDFRSNLKKAGNVPTGGPGKNVNLERPLDTSGKQIDFRDMLKNKTSTKTLSEGEKRRQQAEQMDFRSQLKK